MAGEAAAAMASLKTVQTILALLQANLGISQYMCPIDSCINHLTSIGTFDVIIVGGGSTGSVLLNRLSECSKLNILVLEAGGCAPLESMFPAYFPYLSRSQYDYNITSINDNYSGQNIQGHSVALTAGKMWGGSSSLHQMVRSNGDPQDFCDWEKMLDNCTFSYSNMLRYFKKTEDVHDRAVLKKYGAFHGRCGPTVLRKQWSCDNQKMIDAFVELGVKARVDTNNNYTLGITEPLLEIDHYYRQSELYKYLYPVKDRPNLHFLSNAMVTKIILDDNKVATGVEFTYKGQSYSLNAKKEVILAAGALKTPQLLMLSGIGDPTHLASKNITTLVKNEHVGKNLQDHPCVVMLYTLEPQNCPSKPLDPHKYPAKLTYAYISLNDTENKPSYQIVPVIFKANSTELLNICLNTFQFDECICQAMYNANINRKVLFALPNLLQPVSKGYVKLNTTDINDQPLVRLNHFKNRTYLVNMGKYLANFSKIENTKTFRNISAKFKDLGICSNYKPRSAEYWQCYVLAMSNTIWHFCGSCRIGSCLDTSFRVEGTRNLRVVDASSIPKIPSGNIHGTVVALAELAADVIKKELGYSYYCCRRSNKKH